MKFIFETYYHKNLISKCSATNCSSNIWRGNTYLYEWMHDMIFQIKCKANFNNNTSTMQTFISFRFDLNEISDFNFHIPTSKYWFQIIINYSNLTLAKKMRTLDEHCRCTTVWRRKEWKTENDSKSLEIKLISGQTENNYYQRGFWFFWRKIRVLSIKMARKIGFVFIIKSRGFFR